MALTNSIVLAQGQGAGSIRGLVLDADFEAPLPLAKVKLVETGAEIATTAQGTYVFSELPPGKYTLLFSKDGYVRQAVADVLVTTGNLTDVDVSLAGDFTDMEEFVVQDLLFGAGSEAALLNLRFESPALLDSIGADLMSRAGASDAAGALRLVTGASVEEGKFAVIRGLPDRYVSSQMNGVRLPTADEDKRAVQLDQFPAPVIESLQVSKTFTPDQQGDASGGAVDVRLKGIPEESIFQIRSQISYNSQVTGNSDFLTYAGGGVGAFGRNDGSRNLQYDNIGEHWTGAVGTKRGDAPIDWKVSLAMGDKYEFDNGVRVGAFASLFYERDSSFYDNGISDSLWVLGTDPGGPLTPETIQGTEEDGDYKTRLFDVTRGVQSVQWGSLLTTGVEWDSNNLRLTHLYTHAADDSATLAEDTRGKARAFPGYDPNDPTGPGNAPTELDDAPYLRLQTLEYTERTTETFQIRGEHSTPLDFEIGPFQFQDPVLDWTVARSSANLLQPDKRQFGSLFLPASFQPAIPPFIPETTTQPGYLDFKPAANFNVGNLQRIFKEIDEQSSQYFANMRFPFEQWSGDSGFAQIGVFADDLERDFKQASFSNATETGLAFPNAGFDEFWSDAWPGEDHPLIDPLTDVDYQGDQDIFALYSMLDIPLNSKLNLIGGVRLETFDIETVTDPEEQAQIFLPGAVAPLDLFGNEEFGNASFNRNYVLPSVSFSYKHNPEWTLRGSYSETVARQTFKELTPIIQQEFLGGPIFIGDPNLRMSSLRNYDLRLDYTPYTGSLVSVSAFKKSVRDPIENVQRAVLFSYTTPTNFPKGELKGYEFEVRQDLGNYWEELDGISAGANATFITTDVRLPAFDVQEFANFGYDIRSREMTGAPEFLYNLYLTYDFDRTQFAIFYTVQGDTLVTGAGLSANNNFVPDVYQKEIGTLNMSLSHRFGDHLNMKIQAKNLTNPEVEQFYRGGFAGGDTTRSSFTKGVEFAFSLGFSF